MTTPLSIQLMTAGLTPGDAISNLIQTTYHILRQWGAKVNIYADFISPEYGAIAQPSHFYRESGEALLWFHYSIYSENVEIALASGDYKVMDYHGICPPHLFKGQNAHLEYLCQRGIDLRPSLHDKFDAYIVHSEYTRLELQRLGYPADRMYKMPYCVDTTKFDGANNGRLSDQLSQLTYFLMVGRVVPQKDVKALINIFSHINRRLPDTALIVVGSRQQTARYQRQLDDLIAKKGLTNRVMFAGQVNDPATLAALFGNATLLFVTSEWESFCVPLAESLYSGVPVVIHDLPPLPEVAGPAGLVIDKTNPQEAADAVIGLLDDRSRYAQLKQVATEFAGQYTDVSFKRVLQDLLVNLSVTIGDQ